MNLIKVPIREIPGHEEFIRVRHLLPHLDLEKGPWIAGGSLLRMITGEPFWAETPQVNGVSMAVPHTAVNDLGECIKTETRSGAPEADIDIWFPDEETNKRVSLNLRSLHGKPHETANARSFKVRHHDRTYLLQCIHKRYFGSVEEIFQSFDFTIAQIASDLEYVVMPDYVMSDITNKQLRLASGHFNKGNFLKRVFKYTANGYNPEPGLLLEVTQIPDEELLTNLSVSMGMVDGYEFL